MKQLKSIACCISPENPEWQAIIFEYEDRILNAGFDGVYLDIIDGFEYWEENG